MSKYTLVTAHPKGKDFLCTYRGENKKLLTVRKTDFIPYFYAPKSNSQKLSVFENINNLEKIYCNHPGEVTTKRELNDKGHGFTYESDVMYDVRYMIDNSNEINPEIQWDVCWIDIETATKVNDKKVTIEEIKSGISEIYSITRLDTLYKKIIVYTTAKIDKKLIYDSVIGNKITELNIINKNDIVKSIQQKNELLKELEGFELIIKTFDKEYDMLDEFCNDLHKYKPDIITAWNVHFDYVTIYNRCKMLGIHKKLSLFDEEEPYIKIDEMYDKNGNYLGKRYKYWTPGYYVMDYQEIYRKRNGKDEKSYTLDYITRKWKVAIPKIHHDFGSDFDKFYEEDPNGFIYYNIVDTISIYLVDKKSSYIDISIMLCNESHCPFIYCTSNRIIVDAFLISELKKNNLVRITPHSKHGEKFKGAYVYANKGYHKCYFCDLDFTSMYPMIMISLNISPETFIEKEYISDFDDYITSCIDTNFIKNKKGMIPLLLEKLFKERKADKKTALKYKSKWQDTGNYEDYKNFVIYWNKQNAKKTILNSFYGVLGDPKYSLYKKEVAHTVTATGQHLIKFATKKLEEKGYKVLYTDSVSGQTKVWVKHGINGEPKLIEIEKMFKYINTTKFEKEYYIPENEELYTLSFNVKTREVEWKRIKAVMRHKCNKKMFRVQLSNYDFVDVTEDHSVYCYYENKIYESKPTELKGHVLYLSTVKHSIDSTKHANVTKLPNEYVTLRRIQKVYEIEYDNYVYDLTVENNNNFFANNILCHNTDSCYVKLKEHNFDDFSIEKEYDMIVECVKEIENIYNYINSTFEELKKSWNLLEHRFEMKTEFLGRNIFIVEKKMYSFAEILGEKHLEDLRNLQTDNEIKTYLENSNLYPSDIIIKGLPIIKSMIPEILANYNKKILQDLIHGKINEDKFVNIMKILWERKIVPEAKKNPCILAKTIKKNKEPVNPDVEWLAIKRYNEKNKIKIELGEKVYFIRTLTPERGIVWKMNEEPPKIPIDFAAMYDATYKNIQEQFINTIMISKRC